MKNDIKRGFIYEIICPIAKSPVYIGKTIKTINERLNRHISKTKSKIKYNRKLSKMEYWIKQMINKSHCNQIIINIIEECDLEILDSREIYWISEYKKYFKLKNLTIGGDGGLGYKHNDESLKKISKNRKGKCCGEDHHNYGKKIGKEKWFKLSELSKSINNPNIGKSRSEETKKKISLANSGEKNGMFGKKFERTKEQKLRLSNSLKNSEKLKNSRNSKEYKNKISDHFSQPLYILDMDFNIIKEFKNCRECAEEFNYTKGNIKNAMRFLRKIGKGRDFKYWVVKKQNCELSISLIKEKLNSYML